LIASSCSQRQIVDADASVTPRSITNRCSSVREKRPNGQPCVAGNSRAIAFTSATCSGGKTARATRARLVLQPLKTVLGEPSSPTPDQPRRSIQPCGDLGVMQTISGIEHDPRPLHLLEGQLLRPGSALKHDPLVIAELNPVTRSARYFRTRLLAAHDPLALRVFPSFPAIIAL
jgi:hypothetical protein